MSPMKTSILGFMAAALFLLGMTACSDINKNAVIDPETGEHAENWVEVHPAAYLADQTSCNGCHVADRVGGITMVSCGTATFGGITCHDQGSCTTCHTNPPSGTEEPNVAGAHVVYFLANVALHDGCNTCHSGAGIGTFVHANGVVDVHIMDDYTAKSAKASGAKAVHNADGTCSNVSCHGGQKTPAWLTGKIDSNAECAKCHASGTDEYNSFNSGKHDRHVNDLHLTCVSCHDTAKLVVNHWKTLNTPELEGPASDTINDSFQYDNGSCSPGCHNTRSW